MAVVILSTVIVSALYAFGVSLSAIGAADENMRAQHLLKEKIAEAEYGGGSLPARGVFPQPDADFEWRTDISSTSRFPDDTDLRKLTVTVWRDGQGPRYSLMTYITSDKIQLRAGP